MKILSKTLTERTTNLVTKIHDSVRLPVKYFPIADRPNSTGTAAGSVDPYGTNGIYSVWLNDRLPTEAFEVDLLHELRHILQVQAGFPSVFNKDTTEFYSPMKTDIENLGGTIASVILDLEVNHWLVQSGYSHSFFTDGNADALLSIAPNSPQQNKFFPQEVLCLALLHGSLYVDDTYARRIFDAYSQQEKAVTSAEHLRKKIAGMDVSDPQHAAIAQGLLIDTLGLWKFYFILLHDRKIRTHQEYLSFCTEVGAFPDK